MGSEETKGTQTTRAAVLTPRGRGAVAVVRVWGPNALSAVDSVFRPVTPRSLARTRPGDVRFGRVGAGLGDEVVAVVTQDAPPEVELHGHGGMAAVNLILEALAGIGVECRQPAAWVRGNARSIIEAEATVDLARAPTLRCAEILLEQAQGALDRELAAIARSLDRSMVEASNHVARLIARADVGLRLTTGWRVVLAGRPNVGKSRLLNALAGYERAIVDPTPGTTLDVVTLSTALEGWPVEVSDTAGRRDALDLLEREGIGRARASQRLADLVLLILDRSEPLTRTDQTLVDEFPEALVVANKSDLPLAWEVPGLVSVTVSAESGAGLDSLGAAIVSRLIPEPPEAGAGVPFRPRHLRGLREVRDALANERGAEAADRLARLRRVSGRG
ncbi:MAG: GTPase [Isosphaeraceae bacterium]